MERADIARHLQVEGLALQLKLLGGAHQKLFVSLEVLNRLLSLLDLLFELLLLALAVRVLLRSAGEVVTVGGKLGSQGRSTSGQPFLLSLEEGNSGLRGAELLCQLLHFGFDLGSAARLGFLKLLDENLCLTHSLKLLVRIRSNSRQRRVSGLDQFGLANEFSLLLRRRCSEAARFFFLCQVLILLRGKAGFEAGLLVAYVPKLLLSLRVLCLQSGQLRSRFDDPKKERSLVSRVCWSHLASDSRSVVCSLATAASVLAILSDSSLLDVRHASMHFSSACRSMSCFSN